MRLDGAPLKIRSNFSHQTRTRFWRDKWTDHYVLGSLTTTRAAYISCLTPILPSFLRSSPSSSLSCHSPLYDKTLHSLFTRLSREHSKPCHLLFHTTRLLSIHQPGLVVSTHEQKCSSTSAVSSVYSSHGRSPVPAASWTTRATRQWTRRLSKLAANSSRTRPLT